MKEWDTYRGNLNETNTLQKQGMLNVKWNDRDRQIDSKLLLKVPYCPMDPYCPMVPYCPGSLLSLWYMILLVTQTLLTHMLQNHELPDGWHQSEMNLRPYWHICFKTMNYRPGGTNRKWTSDPTDTYASKPWTTGRLGPIGKEPQTLLTNMLQNHELPAGWDQQEMNHRPYVSRIFINGLDLKVF